MIYIVRIPRQLVIEVLSKDYKMDHGLETIEGLPPDCDLIAANIEANGVLVLSFLNKNGDDHKIMDQPITIQTNDTREA